MKLQGNKVLFATDIEIMKKCIRFKMKSSQ